MKVKYTFIIACWMLAGCWQERREVPKQEIEPQVIKVNQSQGKDIHFIDLLEDYRLINLELTEVSALINPEKALLVDDRFYLLDRRLRQVQVFDTKGRFVTNLVPAGAGPGECHSITALAYDKDHQQILAGCREKRKIFRFDHQLNFLGAITLSGG
ncbi:MAG TPA: 6-bladed beta-propeller, partial [Flammeovirgaceae bacterium]|nr:6-bladed beta-propeller [Flammeovirgaceae bacterium]